MIDKTRISLHYHDYQGKSGVLVRSKLFMAITDVTGSCST